MTPDQIILKNTLHYIQLPENPGYQNLPIIKLIDGVHPESVESAINTLCEKDIFMIAPMAASIVEIANFSTMGKLDPNRFNSHVHLKVGIAEMEAYIRLHK